MARRKDKHFLATVADAPWPVGVALGLATFLGIRFVTGPVLSQSQNLTLAAIGNTFSTGALAGVAWVLLAAFWSAALVSWVRSRQRRRLLRTQTGLDSLRAMRWPDFELLVGEAFRQQGYGVEETSLGGADGGIDLVLRRPGETVLVQCKQWRRRKVDVGVVREMFGLLVHHRAQRIAIVSVGDFTADARAFAQDKPIDLITGEALLLLVCQGQAQMPGDVSGARAPADPEAGPTPAPDSPAGDGMPACPQCGAVMVKRSNRRSGQMFLGCTGFPSCRGTRALS